MRLSFPPLIASVLISCAPSPPAAAPDAAPKPTPTAVPSSIASAPPATVAAPPASVEPVRGPAISEPVVQPPRCRPEDYRKHSAAMAAFVGIWEGLEGRIVVNEIEGGPAVQLYAEAPDGTWEAWTIGSVSSEGKTLRFSAQRPVHDWVLAFDLRATSDGVWKGHVTHLHMPGGRPPSVEASQFKRTCSG